MVTDNTTKFERRISKLKLDATLDSQDVQNQYDIAEALHRVEKGESVAHVPEEAIKIAKQVHEVNESLSKMLSGIDPTFQKTPPGDYLWPNRHDPEKVVGDEDHKNEWKEDMLKWFGDRTYPELDRDARLAALEHRYNAIKARSEGEIVSTMQTYSNSKFDDAMRRIGLEREFIANTPQDRIDHLNKYGSGDIRTEILRGIRQRSRDIALAHKFPPGNIYQVVNNLRDNFIRSMPGRDKEWASMTRAQRELWQQDIDIAVARITGAADIPNGTLWGRAERDFQQAAITVATSAAGPARGVTHIIPTTQALAGVADEGMVRAAFDIVRSMAHDNLPRWWTKRDQETHMETLQIANAHFNSSMMYEAQPGADTAGFLGKLARVLEGKTGVEGLQEVAKYFNKGGDFAKKVIDWQSFLPWFKKYYQISVADGISRLVGNYADRTFYDLPSSLQDTLGTVNVNPHLWDHMIAPAAKTPQEMGYNWGSFRKNKKYVTPEGVKRLTDDQVDNYLRESGFLDITNSQLGEKAKKVTEIQPWMRDKARIDAEMAIRHLLNEAVNTAGMQKGTKDAVTLDRWTPTDPYKASIARLFLTFKAPLSIIHNAQTKYIGYESSPINRSHLLDLE
jgi:hypothetical protein